MSTHRRRPRPQGGFTLIELLVVLTVAAIMVGLAVPSFRSFTAGQRVKAAASDLNTAVLLGRSEAIKRNGAVTVTPTSGAWVNGWTLAVGGTTLQSQGALTDVTVTTYSDSRCTSAATVATLSFSGNGRPASSSCFKFTSAQLPTTARCVSVDLTGIPSVKAWDFTNSKCP